MAGTDNSFERQMIDFYGFKECRDSLYAMFSRLDKDISSIAAQLILFEMLIKHNGISRQDVEREKDRIQRELYSQLEKDRQGRHDAA